MKRATVLFALLLAVTGLIAGQAGAARTAPAATERLQALEQGILARLNAARASHGLHALTLSDDLQSAAVAHSRSMLVAGFFEHDSKDGSPFFVRVKRFYRAAGYNGWSAGENLLYNTAEMDAATAIEAWLDSPAHRENMLAPGWRDVGIGALHASAAGGTFGGEPTWVITMDFGTRSGGKAEKPAATLEVAKAKPNKARPKHTTRPNAKPAKAARPDRPVKQKLERVLPMPARDAQDDITADDTTADDTTADDITPDDTAADDTTAADTVDVAGESGDDELDNMIARHLRGNDEEGDADSAADPPLEP